MPRKTSYRYSINTNHEYALYHNFRYIVPFDCVERHLVKDFYFDGNLGRILPRTVVKYYCVADLMRGLKPEDFSLQNIFSVGYIPKDSQISVSDREKVDTIISKLNIYG